MKQKKNLMMRLVVALVLLVGICVNANAGDMTLRKVEPYVDGQPVAGTVIPYSAGKHVVEVTM